MRDLNTIIANKYIQMIIWIITISCAFIGAYSSIAIQNQQIQFYNADHLYIPSIYQDILNGYSLEGWKFTPAPYFFPDMPLYFVIRWVTNSVHLAMPIYGVVQSLIFLYGFIVLNRVLFKEKDSIYQKMTLCLFILLLMVIPKIIENKAFFSIFLMSFHFGVVVVIPYVLALTISIFESSVKVYRLYILLFILISLTIASDMLFLVQCIIPIIVTICLFSLKNQIKFTKSIKIILFLMVSVGCGVILNNVLIRYKSLGNYSDISIDSTTNAFEKLSNWVIASAENHPFISFFWILSIVVLLIRSIIFIIHKEKSNKSNFIVLYIVISIIVTLAVVVVTGNSSDRYFIPSAILPLFFGWIYLFTYTDFRLLGHYISIIPLLLTLSNLPVLSNIKSLSIYHDYYPSIVQCIDERAAQNHVSRGISSYQLAKTVNVLSRQSLEMGQAQFGSLSPLHWINNKSVYNQKFDFILVARNDQFIKYLFGEPSTITDCEGTPIFTYTNPADTRFNDHWRDHPALNHLDTVGDKVFFNAEQVESSIMGHFEQHTHIVGRGNRGFLSTGIVSSLPKGVYKLDVIYTVQDEKNQYSGSWKIGTWSPNGITTINNGYIVPSKNRISSIFSLDQESEINIDIFYDGQGTVSFKGFEISRIK